MYHVLSRLMVKSRDFVHREGWASFARHAFISLLLGGVGLLLWPFKRRPQDEPFFAVFDRFVVEVNAMRAPAVLELGSRNVRGVVRRNLFSGHVAYTGFDIHPGENVDVVGDAHVLSAHVPAGQFDAVFSVSVFEHLAMPWKVVLELNRVLKPGGMLFISTHPVWPAHELPWDFWRFSCETFKVLLNQQTGFEIVACVQGNPARIVSLSLDPTTSGVHRAQVFQSVAVIARKCGEPDIGLRWDVTAQALLDSMYPRSND
jgi:SAM-dependent methyltransferase